MLSHNIQTEWIVRLCLCLTHRITMDELRQAGRLRWILERCITKDLFHWSFPNIVQEIRPLQVKLHDFQIYCGFLGFVMTIYYKSMFCSVLFSLIFSVFDIWYIRHVCVPRKSDFGLEDTYFKERDEEGGLSLLGTWRNILKMIYWWGQTPSYWQGSLEGWSEDSCMYEKYKKYKK